MLKSTVSLRPFSISEMIYTCTLSCIYACVYILIYQIRSVAQSCPTLCNPMNHSTPGLPVHHQLPEFTQTHVIESVMPSSHLILCRPLLLLPPIPPSIRVFFNESTLCCSLPVSSILGILPARILEWVALPFSRVSFQARD